MAVVDKRRLGIIVWGDLNLICNIGVLYKENVYVYS